RAAIPQEHGAAAVLALRNHALEVTVLHRVVFGLHRQALVAGVEARALRHRPRQQHAVQLEAEVVMQRGGPVLLDDERKAGRVLRSDLAARLGSLAEIALRVILLERHRRLWPGPLGALAP